MIALFFKYNSVPSENGNNDIVQPTMVLGCIKKVFPFFL